MATIPYITPNHIDSFIEALEITSASLFKRFKDYQFKSKLHKYQYILNSTIPETIINIVEFTKEHIGCEKLLWVEFDHKLSFDSYVSNMYENASRKFMQ